MVSLLDVCECLQFQLIHIFSCLSKTINSACAPSVICFPSFSIIHYFYGPWSHLCGFCKCIGSNIPTLWELKSEQDSGGGEFRSKMRQEEEEAGADGAKLSS